jgi:hypothetical protein
MSQIIGRSTIESAQKSPPQLSGEFWTIGRFAILLAGTVLAAFPLVAIGSHTLFYRDFGAMWYRVNVYTRNSFLSGAIPLWNPFIHCGVPFQAQMGQWYPPLLLAIFFAHALVYERAAAGACDLGRSRHVLALEAFGN